MQAGGSPAKLEQSIHSWFFGKIYAIHTIRTKDKGLAISD